MQDSIVVRILFFFSFSIANVHYLRRTTRTHTLTQRQRYHRVWRRSFGCVVRAPKILGALLRHTRKSNAIALASVHASHVLQWEWLAHGTLLNESTRQFENSLCGNDSLKKVFGCTLHEPNSVVISEFRKCFHPSSNTPRAKRICPNGQKSSSPPLQRRSSANTRTHHTCPFGRSTMETYFIFVFAIECATQQFVYLQITIRSSIGCRTYADECAISPSWCPLCAAHTHTQWGTPTQRCRTSIYYYCNSKETKENAICQIERKEKQKAFALAFNIIICWNRSYFIQQTTWLCMIILYIRRWTIFNRTLESSHFSFVRSFVEQICFDKESIKIKMHIHD